MVHTSRDFPEFRPSGPYRGQHWNQAPARIYIHASIAQATLLTIPLDVEIGQRTMFYH